MDCVGELNVTSCTVNYIILLFTTMGKLQNILNTVQLQDCKNYIHGKPGSNHQDWHRHYLRV